MTLTYSDVAEIIRLIDASTLDEIVIEVGDLKIEVRRRVAQREGTGPAAVAGRLDGVPSPAPAPGQTPPPRRPGSGSPGPLESAPAESAPVESAPVESAPVESAPVESAPVEVAPAGAAPVEVADGQLAVRSPMVGTFYRRPSPEEPPFVEVGNEVEAGAALGLVEVMKLFTTIYATHPGRVARVCAEDAALVEYDQILFVLDPR